MEQEEITKIYETLAPMAGDYANAQAEQIGMAQQSMGPLAANTMGTTTSGLGNYTYNRLMRPQVDTMRDEIMVQGYANKLNRLLSDRLNEARNRYNRSGNGSGGTGDGNGNGDKWNGEYEETEIYSGADHLTPEEAWEFSSGYQFKPTKEELEASFAKPMTDAAYAEYERIWAQNRE